MLSHSVLSNSLQAQPNRLLYPWGFSRQKYWSGLPCPPPGDLTNPGIKPRSPTLQVHSLLSEPPGKPENMGVGSLSLRRRQWHPTPVLLPGKSHGWRSRVGCSPWGHEESDTTERLHFHFSFFLFFFFSTFTFHFNALEKEMATHSSVLAWRIPGIGEPGGLPSMGSHRVGHN